MTDLHSLAGRTMSGGEAALRAKMAALADQMEHLDLVHGPHFAGLVRDVLNGKHDPRESESN